MRSRRASACRMPLNWGQTPFDGQGLHVENLSMRLTRCARPLAGIVLVAACASAPLATTTRSLPGTKVFSGTSQTGGPAATPWTRTDIYAHTSATDSQYVGTTVHYEVPITTSVTGVRTIELAMSADGRSI